MDVKTPLYKIFGIGSIYAKRLERLEIFTIEDLIYHFPFRYDDYSKVSKIAQTSLGEKVTLSGEVWQIKNVYTRFGKVLTRAILNDGSAVLELIWFNQPYLTKSISSGDTLHVAGKVGKFGSKLSLVAPDWEKWDRSLHTGRLVPVYPETAGLSSKWLRNQISKFLPQALEKVEEFLPDQIKNSMISESEALNKIHFPQNWDDIKKAKIRLGFDELFLIQLATQRARFLWSKKTLIKPWKIDEGKLNSFIHSLPFKLTNSQQKVIKEIMADLKNTSPMNRLLQGEVGSGKTVMATITMYLSYLNGFQSLFMAPTEILAWQHYDTVKKLLEPLGIKVGIYTGSKKRVQGTVDNVIIGTHALLSDKLAIPDVGLVIIDEQHRFGVEQRTLLRSKGAAPHFLTMTATPIPRTVALTLYGDLDLSIIDELPSERIKVKTFLVPELKRRDSYKFISTKVMEGDQVYIITPLIELSETQASVKAAKVEFERLQKIFPKLNLGLLHGRMKAKEKEKVLEEFRNNAIQILVATSVVEVGMDIPNATIMVIEGAEKFGLAQLHQLRGRVGRGKKQSYCLLYTSEASNEESRRLKYLETTFDGLKLAELDLKIRGSGTIFSTAQHGRFDLRIARLSDIEAIEKAKQSATQILRIDPSLDKYPLLKARLDELAKEVMPD
ncbi:ATP-dependent DNA helicase RecG [Candidatus Microgenomates bacterium]|nr:ATP-dependent DNA helicase RecG [Candidatus Microgenomates bacterium]